MSFQKFITNSYCVGHKGHSATKDRVGEITRKKSNREIQLLVGQCSFCNRKKSMIVSDNTIQVGSLSDLFRNLGKKDLKCQKGWRKIYSKILPEHLISQQKLLQQR